MDKLIPLMGEADSAGGRPKLKDIAVQFCLDNPNYYIVVRNRRGHPVRALLKPRMSLQPLLNAGKCFLEPLPNVGRRVYSLRRTEK